MGKQINVDHIDYTYLIEQHHWNRTQIITIIDITFPNSHPCDIEWYNEDQNVCIFVDYTCTRKSNSFEITLIVTDTHDELLYNCNVCSNQS